MRAVYYRYSATSSCRRLMQGSGDTRTCNSSSKPILEALRLCSDGEGIDNPHSAAVARADSRARACGIVGQARFLRALSGHGYSGTTGPPGGTAALEAVAPLVGSVSTGAGSVVRAFRVGGLTDRSHRAPAKLEALQPPRNSGGATSSGRSSESIALRPQPHSRQSSPFSRRGNTVPPNCWADAYVP
jgi:hypothetical protein